MTKNLFILLFLFLMTTSLAYAQNGQWQWDIGVTGGEALTKSFSSSFGTDIGLEKNLDGPVSATMGIGFIHLFEKNIYGLAGYSGGYGESYNAFPVKAGLKLSLSKSLYIGADAGIALSSDRYGNSFIWSPSVGVALESGLNFSLHYENIERIKGAQTVGLRVGYGLPFNKKRSFGSRNEIQSWQIGVGFSAGTVSTGPCLTWGAEVSAYKILNDYFEAVLTTGFTHIGQQIPLTIIEQPILQFYYKDVKLIPLKAGLRFYPGSNFYLSGDVGEAIRINGTGAFNYTPGLGLKFSYGLDLGMKYDAYSGQVIPNTISLKLGYRFKL